MICDECLHEEVCKKKKKYKEKFEELNTDEDFAVDLQCKYYKCILTHGYIKL